MQLYQGAQGRRRIGRAAAETSRDGEVFFQHQLTAQSASAGLLERGHGAQNQIVFCIRLLQEVGESSAQGQARGRRA